VADEVARVPEAEVDAVEVDELVLPVAGFAGWPAIWPGFAAYRPRSRLPLRGLSTWKPPAASVNSSIDLDTEIQLNKVLF
jgi:hypothetical protein